MFKYYTAYMEREYSNQTGHKTTKTSVFKMNFEDLFCVWLNT
jgi:hypothetical protein